MSLEIRLPRVLRQVRLPTVACHYKKLAQEAIQSGQSYEEYLLALLEEEVTQRQVNQRKRRVREAHFPVLRMLDEFDFGVIPSIRQQQVIQLVGGAYLQQQENIALIGSIGTGKTHIAISLGLAACQQGHKVRFYTAAGLINELQEAKQGLRLSHLEAKLLKYKLIILDELGFISVVLAQHPLQ